MFNLRRFNAKHVYVTGAVATGIVTILLFAFLENKPAGALTFGSADNFAILAGSTITSTGATTVVGDIGLHPGTALTQSPNISLTGTIHLTDAMALAAKDSLVTTYNAAAGAASTQTITTDLGGMTLLPGVFTSASSLGVTGTLTLDAALDPDATWIFQAGSTLTTASGSSVVVINGGNVCNVFWQVGSSATLGSSSTLIGSVLALTSISANSGATVDGRLLARNGAVTLIGNTISRPTCVTSIPTPTPSPTPAVTALVTPTPAVTALVTPTPGVTALVTPTPGVTPKPAPSSQVIQKPTGSVGTGG